MREHNDNHEKKIPIAGRNMAKHTKKKNSFTTLGEHKTKKIVVCTKRFVIIHLKMDQNTFNDS